MECVRTHFRCLAVSVVAVAAFVVPVFAAAAGAVGPEQPAFPPSVAPLDEHGKRIYIVQLAESPLAAYPGAVLGRAATESGQSMRGLAIELPENAAWLAHLARGQDQLRGAIARELGRKVPVAGRYRIAFNGLALRLSPDEAGRLEGLPGVVQVYPEQLAAPGSDNGVQMVGAPSAWHGMLGGVGESRGEGVIVGTIDTGINLAHPAFAATDGDGYTHVNPLGADVYLGWCDSNPGFCNSKLIGAWDFTGSASPEDESGHGSHVAGIAVGNRHLAEPVIADSPQSIHLGGVAPRASLIAYKACSLSCPSSALLAAFDQAILDGVDVINYSISGSLNPWTDPIQQAMLAAHEAGIFVSAMAIQPGITPRVTPWVAITGTSTHQRLYAMRLSLDGGPQDRLAAPSAEGPVLGENYAAAMRWAGDVDADNTMGCSTFPAGAFTGQAALIWRGQCTFATKVDNAQSAGATLVVIADQSADVPFSMGGLAGTTIPALLIRREDGDALVAALAGGTATVSINADLERVLDSTLADRIDSTAGGGPGVNGLMAPSLVAPGVNILSANSASGGQAARWQLLKGASMSTAFVAGAGTLLKAVHPDWTPAEIRSALMMSARPHGLVARDGVGEAGPFERGSGRLDIDAAGRMQLLMNESVANFTAADPASGGDPRTLNLAQLVDGRCLETCSFTRSLRSIADAPVFYRVAVEAPPGMSVTVSPDEFGINPGQQVSLEVNVTVDATLAESGDWAFAELSIFNPAVAQFEPIDDFSGDLALANWNLVNNPSTTGGSLSFETGPPVRAHIIGGDDSVGGFTELGIEVPQTGRMRFDWGYQSTDSGTFDCGEFVHNGDVIDLACNNSQVPFYQEQYIVDVNAGDQIAFRVRTVDGAEGAGTLGVTNLRFAPLMPAAQMPIVIYALGDQIFVDRFQQ